jgi:hypothetical protein
MNSLYFKVSEYSLDVCLEILGKIIELPSQKERSCT